MCLSCAIGMFEQIMAISDILIGAFIMNIKITTISAGILVALSTSAGATTLVQAPAVPSIYSSGPEQPVLTSVALSEAERAAYALYEGVLQIAEAKIHATNCAPESFNINVYADGSLNDPTYNYVNVFAFGSSTQEFKLAAAVQPESPNRGQQIIVSLVGSGNTFNGTKINAYSSTLVYNNLDNLLVANNATISINGVNGLPDIYSGTVIKDFYMGNVTDPTNPDYYNIIDWGLQSVSKLGYPVEKWWQRSKSHRNDGTGARTVFVKDRLVGASQCRITIDTTGTNDGYNLFWQGSSNPDNTGVLTIGPSYPSDLVNPDATGNEAWNQSPFNNQ